MVWTCLYGLFIWHNYYTYLKINCLKKLMKFTIYLTFQYCTKLQLLRLNNFINPTTKLNNIIFYLSLQSILNWIRSQLNRFLFDERSEFIARRKCTRSSLAQIKFICMLINKPYKRYGVLHILFAFVLGLCDLCTAFFFYNNNVLNDSS